MNYLNSDEAWVHYNSSTNTYFITDIGSFVKKCKYPIKEVPAFDHYNYNNIENSLFGVESKTKVHFDNNIKNILQNYDWELSGLNNYAYYYKYDYEDDIYNKRDSLGNTVEHRANMYNPMYYICKKYSGYKSSKVASYFRINSGITQGETSNCVEMNLALALTNLKKNVEFTTVWDKGHVEAERGSNNSTFNFISWVNKCMNISGDQKLNPDYSNNGNLDTISSNNYYTKINKKYIIFIWFLLL